MAIQATMSGARLAFVVVPIEGTVRRPVHRYSKDKGVTVESAEQPGGFMVYFPRGHAIRIRDKEGLKQYKLDKKARIINLQGLNDPNSPIGQLMASQDEKVRQGAMVNLERQVIALATAKSGQTLLPEQVQERDEEEDVEDGKLVVRQHPQRRQRNKESRKVAA